MLLDVSSWSNEIQIQNDSEILLAFYIIFSVLVVFPMAVKVSYNGTLLDEKNHIQPSVCLHLLRGHTVSKWQSWRHTDTVVPKPCILSLVNQARVRTCLYYLYRNVRKWRWHCGEMCQLYSSVDWWKWIYSFIYLFHQGKVFLFFSDNGIAKVMNIEMWRNWYVLWQFLDAYSSSSSISIFSY